MRRSEAGGAQARGGQGWPRGFSHTQRYSAAGCGGPKPAAPKPAGARDGPAGVKLEADVRHEDVAVLREPGDHGAAAGVVEANLAAAEERAA